PNCLFSSSEKSFSMSRHLELKKLLQVAQVWLQILLQVYSRNLTGAALPCFRKCQSASKSFVKARCHVSLTVVISVRLPSLFCLKHSRQVVNAPILPSS